MSIAFDPHQYHLKHYQIELNNLWQSSKQKIHSRQGWVTRITDTQGLSGYGDCAPMPAIGTESLAQAQEHLKQKWQKGWQPVDTNSFPANPAAGCAMETAWLDLTARQANTSLAKILHSQAADRVLVNGMAHSLQLAPILKLEQEGYRIIKVKVGLESVATELLKIQDICKHLNNTRLRLDANGAWSQTQAEKILTGLEGLPIESIEEPLHNPSLLKIEKLQQATPITIALDESLSALDFSKIINSRVRRIVLKPMLIGSLTRVVEMASAAAKQQVESIITTTIDSAAGTCACTHLAAAIEPICPGMHHGLATANLLRTDTGEPPLIKTGKIILNHNGGSGFIPYAKNI